MMLLCISVGGLTVCVEAMAADEQLPSIEKVVLVNDLGENLSKPELLEIIKTKVGERLDSNTLLNDVNSLIAKRPEYQNITTNIEPIESSEDGAVKVTFEFQMKRKIKAVRLIFAEEIDVPETLRDKLSSYRGALFKANYLELDKSVLREEFIYLGYAKAQVTHELNLDRNGKDVRISYHIKTALKRMLVTDIEFKGNKGIRSSKLEEVIESRTRSWFLAKRPKFKLFNLDEDMEKLEKFYVDNGFLDARVSYEFKIKKDRYVYITIKVEEGRKYRVNRIAVVGNDLFLSSDLIKMFTWNDRGYSEKDIRKGLQKVREAYGKIGYPLLEVNVSYDSTKERLYLFLKEGKQQQILEVTVAGNVKMKKETILLDVSLKDGDRVDTVKIKESLDKMKSMGYYSDVQIDYVPKTDVSGDLVIQIKEASNQFIRFGAGMGGNGAFGDMAYGNNNLFGTGKGLSLHLQKSKEMTKIGLLYTDPHLMGSDLELTARVTAEEQDNDDYQKRKLATLIMVEKAINKNLTIGIGTRIEFLNIDKVKDEIANQIHDAEGNGTIVGLVSTIFYTTETKDSMGDNKSGYRVKLAFMPSYSDQGAYVKTFANFMAHKSLGTNAAGVSHTISGRITLGFASENAPFHEKFYGGGISTIRGFEGRSITLDNGLGGNAVVALGASYSFPIWGQILKGVIFVEAMALGEDITSMGNVRAVGGLGVKANLRNTFLGSTIEAGVAIPFMKQEGDQTKPFYFIFGDYDPAYDL